MDLRTTDALKTAAAAWLAGKPLIVETRVGVMTYASVAVVDGVVYLRLDEHEPRLDEAVMLEEMNRDPTTGAAFKNIPVEESAPEPVPALQVASSDGDAA